MIKIINTLKNYLVKFVENFQIKEIAIILRYICIKMYMCGAFIFIFLVEINIDKMSRTKNYQNHTCFPITLLQCMQFTSEVHDFYVISTEIFCITQV